MPEPNQDRPKTSELVERINVPTAPLIFISHDSRDAELAEAFSKLLSSVSAGVLKSFRSSDSKGSQGIEYGSEWYPALMAKLNAASDIVCLLTPRSLDRPWILFEAGVAKGKLNTPVHGIALGIPLGRAHIGPFAQFHNCEDNEDALTKLVIQLLERIPNSEPDKDAIQMQVKSFIQKATEILKKLGDAKDSKQDKVVVDETSVAKLFEEVKIMFQDLPSRVESRLSDSIDPMRKRKMRRFDPMFFEEMLHFSEKSDDPFGLLNDSWVLPRRPSLALRNSNGHISNYQNWRPCRDRESNDELQTNYGICNARSANGDVYGIQGRSYDVQRVYEDGRKIPAQLFARF